MTDMQKMIFNAIKFTFHKQFYGNEKEMSEVLNSFVIKYFEVLKGGTNKNV